MGIRGMTSLAKELRIVTMQSTWSYCIQYDMTAQLILVA